MTAAGHAPVQRGPSGVMPPPPPPTPPQKRPGTTSVDPQSLVTTKERRRSATQAPPGGGGGLFPCHRPRDEGAGGAGLRLKGRGWGGNRGRPTAVAERSQGMGKRLGGAVTGGWKCSWGLVLGYGNAFGVNSGPQCWEGGGGQRGGSQHV